MSIWQSSSTGISTNKQRKNGSSPLRASAVSSLRIHFLYRRALEQFSFDMDAAAQCRAGVFNHGKELFAGLLAESLGILPEGGKLWLRA